MNSAPPFPTPFFSLSSFFFQFSQKHAARAHTKIHTHSLLQAQAHKTYISALFPRYTFIPVYTAHLSQVHWRNARSIHTLMVIISFSLLLQKQISTTSSVCVCCFPSFLIPLISKRQFWVLSLSQKKERRKYLKTTGSDTQLSCNVWAQLQKMAQVYSQLKENVT